MKPHLKVLLIFDMPVQPQNTDYASQMRPEDWKNQLDVIQALKKLGHTVRLLGLHDSIRPLLKEIRRHPPDIVFNLLEIFANDRQHESNIAGLLDLLQVPYTGSRPACLSLCRNKFFTQRILVSHRIPVPYSLVFALGQKNHLLRPLRFPVIVKPLGLEGSDGIAQSSWAETPAACWKRIKFLHTKWKTDALVEEYIAGRELYASVIGNRHLRVLPLREMIFHQFPAKRPKFATAKAKWDKSFRERWGIENTFALPLPRGLERKIGQISRLAFRLLNLSGYGRIDLRLTPKNEIYLIEVNPNPNLEKTDELAQSARQAKLSYPQLIQRILHYGLECHGPA